MAETATQDQGFQPVGGDELRKALGAEFGGPAADLFERGQKSTYEAARAKADREAAGAMAKASAVRDYATQIKQETAKAEGKIGEMPQFQVTKDTQEGMMGLAALLPLAGLMLGMKGQTSGTNALNAMAGMVTGYREGNQQRIEFERKRYDEEMNRWKANYGMVKDGLERAIKIAQTNMQAGQAEAEAVAARVGSPELKAMVQSQGLTQAYNAVVKAGEEQAKYDHQLALAKAKVSEAALLSDDAIRNRVDRFLAGDKSAVQNLGTGQAGAANRAKLETEISRVAKERGLSGADQAAAMASFSGLQQAQRTAAQQGARVGIAADEAFKLSELAIDASDKVPRGSFVPLTRLMQMSEAAMSDENLRKFQAANNTFINTYVRAISPTGVPTDSVRSHAYELLKTADSPSTYKAVVDQLRKEMSAAIEAPASFANKYAKNWVSLQNAPTAGAPTSAAAGRPSFSTAEDVAAAYKGGRISREDAEKILREQFRMQ